MPLLALWLTQLRTSDHLYFPVDPALVSPVLSWKGRPGRARQEAQVLLRRDRGITDCGTNGLFMKRREEK